MRRLIINADDFGLTCGVNRAIIDSHRDGLVTSTTLMANSAAFDDAVQLAIQNPQLGVGCHVVLMDGEPLLRPADIPTLVPNARDFRRDFSSFALDALRKRISADEIEREATAQIRKIQGAGLTVTHIDAHKHAHMFPSILRPLLRAARSCGVLGVRNPFEPGKPFAFTHLLQHPRLWTRYTEVTILRSLSTNFRKAVEEAGMVTTSGSVGVVATGALDQSLFESIVGSIPEGSWEFVCHPGYCDADLNRVHTRLRDSRETELRVLTSPTSRAAIQSRGIQLESFVDLKPSGAALRH